MPSRSPFTVLCQQAAAATSRVAADLHVHSTASDGLFTPAEVVAHARSAGLSAVSITDHDTLDAYRHLEPQERIRIIAGVEISTCFHDRELHLLAYGIDLANPALNQALATIRSQRRVRLSAMVDRLRQSGLRIEQSDFDALIASGATLGRRHLARILVESRQVGNVYEAFTRHLARPEFADLPKARLPVETAIELVRDAGGVSSWAHPSSHATIEMMGELQALGLNAIECHYPWSKPSHGRKLQAMAEELGVLMTGGSDCHGPWPKGRMIGCKGIGRSQLDRILARNNSAISTV